MRTVSSRAPRRAAALFVASAAVLLAAACGGGDSSGGGNGGSSGGDQNNAFAAYTQCLAKNGVTITLPSRGPRTGGSRGPGEGYGGTRPSARPSGFPRPSGSFSGRGGFPGGGMFQKPEGVDDATWQKAQAACASVRPSFGAGRNGGNGQNAAFQNCLKDHGVTTDGGTFDPNDAKVKKALETCRVLQPQASPTPSA